MNKNILYKKSDKGEKVTECSSWKQVFYRTSILQSKYSTTLLKAVENKMWGSLIVSKVAGRTPTHLFLWDSLKHIR